MIAAMTAIAAPRMAGCSSTFTGSENHSAVSDIRKPTTRNVSTCRVTGKRINTKPNSNANPAPQPTTDERLIVQNTSGCGGPKQLNGYTLPESPADK